MDVADQIVVMNEGHVEQAGTARDVYDRPANDFVMGFVGEVNRVGESLVRPHDIDILPEGGEAGVEAQIDRVVHLGFEVRVALTLADGSHVWVQTTRQAAEELELEPGQIVGVRVNGGSRLPDRVSAT